MIDPGSILDQTLFLDLSKVGEKGEADV